MHLADWQSYLKADQRLVALYADPDAWTRKAVLNVASFGKFSSDRTIAEYAPLYDDFSPCRQNGSLNLNATATLHTSHPSPFQMIPGAYPSHLSPHTRP